MSGAIEGDRKTLAGKSPPTEACEGVDVREYEFIDLAKTDSCDS